MQPTISIRRGRFDLTLILLLLSVESAAILSAQTHTFTVTVTSTTVHALSIYVSKKNVFGKIFTSHTLTNAGAQNRDDDEIAMGSTFPQG